MEVTFNRTKIIATYGPAIDSKDTMLNMIKAGVDVFRFNFSHGSHEDHKKGMDMLKEINREHGLHVASLADLQGPKIRIGVVENDSFEIEVNQELIFTNVEQISNKDRVYVNYKSLPKDVNKGELILVDDGKMEFEILSTNRENEIRVKALNSGVLSSKKGVNLPNTSISLPCLTEKDRKDLDFALKQDANWIALSFVRSPEDIYELKQIIGDKRLSWQKVIAKIEKPQAVQRINEIIEVTDAIMIARGDLGVEVPIERVPIIQKRIIKKCIKKAKPVIVATQMMDSMIKNPNPTRAEVTDVANAVIDGADAVMLSGETSVGKYPLRVIKTMEKVLANIEKMSPIYNKDLKANKKSLTYISDSMCYNSAKIANDLKAKAIIGMTKSGYTAFMVSSCRPKSIIYIFTDNIPLLYTLNICWGVRALKYDKFVSTDVTIKDVISILKRNKFVFKDDLVVNTASMPLREQGRTNMIKVTIVK